MPAHVMSECVAVEISLSHEMSFTIICMYRSPSAKVDFYDHLKTVLNLCNSNKEIILLGDFNVNWDDKKDRTNMKRTTKYYSLDQLIEKPTRITNTTQTRIDLFNTWVSLFFIAQGDCCLEHFSTIFGPFALLD